MNRGGDHQSSPAVADGVKRPTRGRRAGMFLCHFPSGPPAWALPSALPGGARTFLPSAKGGPAVTRSAGPIRVYHPARAPVRDRPAVTGPPPRHPKLVLSPEGAEEGDEGECPMCHGVRSCPECDGLGEVICGACGG